MQQVFQGKIEVTRIEPDSGCAYGRVRVHIPGDAAAAAGLIVGAKVGAKSHSVGRILISPSTSPGAKTVVRKAVDGFHVVEFIGVKRGIPAVDFPLTNAALTLIDFGLVVFIPDTMPKKYMRKRKSAPAEYVRERPDRGDYRDATAGFHGAAKTLALDTYRYGHLGMKGRAVELEQMLGLLRNAGHRVERVSVRLFRLDGKTATMADLSDAVRRIDADAVLVAEAA